MEILDRARHLIQRPFRSRDAKPRGALDKAVFVIAFVGPLSSLPQIVEIWFVDKSAEGVSAVTWACFLAMSLVWFFYGLSRRDVPLVISNALWVVAEAVILLGALLLDNDYL